jgi:hypothetical protein
VFIIACLSSTTTTAPNWFLSDGDYGTNLWDAFFYGMTGIRPADCFLHKLDITLVHKSSPEPEVT